MNIRRKVLVISPHCDDAEIGCGGYISKLAHEGADVLIAVATVSDIHFLHVNRVVTKAERKAEFSESCKTMGVAGLILTEDYESKLNMFPSGFMVGKIDELMKEFQPTDVLLPLPSSHQDHVYMHQVSVAACRPTPLKSHVQLIAAYEYPSSCWGPASSADRSAGGMYVDVTRYMETKKKALDCYKSQMRDRDSLISWYGCDSLARLRGIESGFAYAELFYVMRHRVH